MRAPTREKGRVMLFRRFRVLRDAEKEQGAGGTEGTSESGAGQPTQPKSEESKSINSQAKELPWVQKALAAEARLTQLEAKQAEAKQKAEQEALEQKGEYEQALKLERDRVAQIEAESKAKFKKLSLQTELVTAGFRPQATKLFIDEFNPDESDAAEFVAKLKSDEDNHWLLVNAKSRTPNPTKPTGKGPAEEFDPSWIDSEDPEKRQKAVEHNRREFWAKFHGKA